MLNRIINPKEEDLIILRQLSKSKLALLLDFLRDPCNHPTQEAADLSEFLIKSAIQLLDENPQYRLAPVSTIGGVPSIVVISRKGVQWIQK
jgi:hypothetical protein